MTLAGMMATDKDALICDLAETYGILDYKALPVKLLATLSSGLRDDARICLIMTGAKADPITVMTAHIADCMTMIFYGLAGSKDTPLLYSDALSGFKKAKKKTTGFDTAEEFEIWKEEIKKGQKE